jgi:predicted pyridoxine 5'-phosphate oxidase superfamily flavin-nucleotide-binding protein
VDIVGIVAGEPDGGAADVFGLADALVRDELHEFAVSFGCSPCFHVDRGPYCSRSHAVDANAIGGHFLGDAFHHQHHASFTGGIVDMTGPGDDFVDAAHANDFSGSAGDILANATPFEFADGFSGAKELSREVDIQDELPIGERHVLNSRIFLEAGIVDEDVDRAELMDHPLEHRLDFVLLADIRAMGEDICAATRGFFHDSIGSFGAGDVVDHHVGPSLGQRDGNGLANAGISAGNQCFLPLEDFVDGAIRHGRLRKIFVPKMLLHQILVIGLIRGHYPLCGRRKFKNVIHIQDLVSSIGCWSTRFGNPYKSDSVHFFCKEPETHATNGADMSESFRQITFTPSVLAAQQAYLGRASAVAPSDELPSFMAEEVDFIEARDSFYIASISETGWPYIQHRGGPAGFLRVLGERRIGFVDFGGNRQLITVGNLSVNDRVSLFLMDYAKRERLKILGHARVVDAKSEPELRALLTPSDYRANVERLVVIDVVAFDWNCPQHIKPHETALPLEPIL